jgi:NAD-dependent SIR2 family protein deacetylase
MGNSTSGITPMAAFDKSRGCLRPDGEGQPTLRMVAQGIAEGRFRNVVVLCGAGISVSAGIPDFRSPGKGLYANLAKYDLPSPEAIFDIDFFKHNPYPFFKLATELYPGKFRPTPTHHFLKLLADKGVLLRCYTQNIDTLESEAGLPENKYVACHGNFASNTCTRCGHQYPPEWMQRALFGADGQGTDPTSVAGAMASGAGISGPNKIPVPRCTKCHAVVKPDITFFGESLPERFARCLKVDVQACDLLLVMGTSLQVYPVGALPDQVPRDVPRVLFNRDPVHIANKFKLSELAGQIGSSDDDDSSDDSADAAGNVGKEGEDAAAKVLRKLSAKTGLSVEELELQEAVDTGFWFNLEENYRDVFAQGNCDDTIREFVGLLGWEFEFDALVAGASIGGGRAADIAVPAVPVVAVAAAAAAAAATDDDDADDADDGTTERLQLAGAESLAAEEKEVGVAETLKSLSELTM